MNIQEYFALKLEGAQLPDDIGALEMPCDSECGRDCMKAIDSASLMLDHIRIAMGEHWPFHARNIIFAAQQIISIYICG
jgi:hypothetical protein